VLQALRDHPNIIKLHDMYFMNTQKMKDSAFVLSFEYADRGDLHRYVCNLKQDITIKKPSASVDFKFIRNVLIQICEGINYMNSKGFIHRDLKTANILLRAGKQGDKYPQVKIADFGLSRNVR
jgi:serine/threonine protein kinase